MGIDISPQYIAGFIDGEGSICISEHRRYSRTVPNGHQLSLSIGNTNIKVLEDIAEWMRELGVKVLIRTYPPTDSRIAIARKTYYQLFTYGNNLKIILPLLKLYIRVKSEQLLVAEEFLKTMPGSNRPVGDDIRTYRSFLSRKLTWLNQGCP